MREKRKKVSSHVACAHLQASDGRYRADRVLDAGRALAEAVVHHLRTNDSPAGPIVQHLSDWLIPFARGGLGEGRGRQ